MSKAKSFQKMSSNEVAEYFKNELEIPDFICQAFEDEMVDGSALLDLTEQDVKDMCKKIGPTKKIYKLIVEIIGDGKNQEKALDALLSVSSPSYSSGLTSDYPNTPKSAASTVHLATPRKLFSASTESDDSSITTHKFSKKFIVPEKWRPSIMQCIQKPSEPEARRMLSTSVRNEIVRDLVTQMYTVWDSPKTTESTLVAKMLVNKYPFIKDQGEGITGFGSWQKKIIDRLHNEGTNETEGY